MRRLLAPLLVVLAGCQPGPEPAAPSLSALPTFADSAVNAFVADADRAARRAAPLTPEFWSWVERRPEIHAGLLFAQHPMPEGFARNLDVLRRAVSPEQADRHAHLLLGVAVASAVPLRAEAERAPAAYPPAASKVAAWMTASGASYLKVMSDQAAALAAAGVDPKEAKSRGFWTEVAHASGTYPPRLAASEVDHVRWLVTRLEEPAPAGAKQAWPLFPVARSPWPLLVWFRAVPPERERDWVWERYWGRVPGQSAGMIGYGRYSWDYDRKPEVKHKASAWHPNALPRISEDGGVCGRLSTMADTFRRTLGIPARGCGQPGHRAFVQYGWDAKKGEWTFGVGQSIAGIESTRVGTGLPAISPWMKDNAVSCQALVGGLNLGLERWQRARILAWYAVSLPTAAGRERTAREALALNPYELGLWKALAEGAEDAPALARVLAAMDQGLIDPNVRLEEAERLSADTDFATLGGGDSKARSQVGNSVARIVGDDLLTAGIERLLKAEGSRTELLAALRREIARREGLKLAHGPAVTHLLLTRLTLLADGPAAAVALAEADLAAVASLKGKARERALDGLVQRLLALRLADPALVARWAEERLSRLAAGARWSVGKDGKPVADRLHAEMHALQVHALGRMGASGKARIAGAKTAFERGRPAPAAPAR